MRNSIMGKHFPTNIWIAKKYGEYPNFEVKTENKKEISISYFYEKGKDGFKLIISSCRRRPLPLGMGRNATSTQL